MYESLDFAAV